MSIHRSSCAGFLAVLCLVSSSSFVAAQSDIATIDTSFASGAMIDPPDFTFGLAMDPDGVHGYATVSGGLGFGGPPNNHRFLKIDLATRTIVDTADVGNFPEAIAIRTDVAGAAEFIFCSDNSDSTLHVMDTDLNVVDVVALGTCTGPFGPSGHFPFPLEFDASQDRLFVGTLGCGDILEVDANPATPNTVSTLINLAGGHAALHADGDTLYVGSSITTAGFASGLSLLYVVDISVSPATLIDCIQVSPETLNDFKSIQDIEPLPNGRLLLVESSSTSADVHIYDPMTNTIVDTIDVGVQASGLVRLHQADLGPCGRVAAITSLDATNGATVFFDVGSRNVISSVAFPAGHQPSFAEYTTDGSEVFVTFQSAEEIRVIGSLPEALELSVSAPAALGSIFSFDVAGTPPFTFATLLVFRRR